MAATSGHSINTGPYGENTEIYSSLKLLHWLNLNCASIIGRSFTNFCVFYVDRNSKMTTTAGHSFYIGPIVFFYNQVNDTGSWEPLVSLFSITSLPFNIFIVDNL
jgi:ABC-type polysaccharide/polyol phosphate export permease